MKKSDTKCFKISDIGICPNCKSKMIIKNGFIKNRKQQYFCKSCKTRSIDYYTNKACCKNINSSIIQLNKEGLGIRSTARIVRISTTTVLKELNYLQDHSSPKTSSNSPFNLNLKLSNPSIKLSNSDKDNELILLSKTLN